MRWLVYGSNGWIGGMVVKLLRKQGETVIKAKERADDEIGVEAEFATSNADRVLCLIGRTHGPGYSTIDYLEQKGKLVENVRDNLYSPLVLALLGKKYGIHVTYLGTGCIFTYSEEQRLFQEKDAPNFFGSGYSTVKGFTDRLMHFFEDSVLNLRIRIPNSMTVLEDMLPVMIDLALKKTTGTINLTNPGTVEHNEILELYQKYVDPTFVWANFTQEEQAKILLSERSNNELDTTTLQRLYPNLLPIRERVELLFQNWNKSELVQS